MTIDDRIRELCHRRGMTFRPWEVTPWEVNAGPCPWPQGDCWRETWPAAQALRRQLIAELRQGRRKD
jgi:hypothetical protein